MATEIAKAYVQILPSTEGIKSKLQSALGGEVSSAGESAGKSMGGSMISAIKGVVAAAGIGAFIKQALDVGGALQQSFGGLDTIYGEASAAAKEYANAAAQAGISANDYAEQAVSFGASLKMAFGGDTTKAVEAANTAILDMTDNAAKMGTPIESIQNAYQGFAKQNYTMLDNLKLGYGGTKSEMERLLADAEKLTGVKYDMENLGDVYAAIHAIQGDLGLTGVAAQEASETFTGSMGAMKASFENLLGAMATGGDIKTPLLTLRENIKTFLLNNLIPMLSNVLNGIPDLIGGALGLLNSLFYSFDMSEVVNFGVNLLRNLAETIVGYIPDLLYSIVELAGALGQALIDFDWSGTVSEMLQNMLYSIQVFAGEFFGTDGSIIDAILDSITSKLPELLNKAGEIAKTIQDGLVASLPLIVDKIREFLPKITEFMAQNLPVVFAYVGDLLNHAIQNLPAILMSILDLVGVIISNLPSIIGAILQSLFALVDSLLGGFFTKVIGDLNAFLERPLYYIGVAVGKIIAKIVQFNNDVNNKLKAFFTETIPATWRSFTDWLSRKPQEILNFFKELPENLKNIGKNIIEGFFNGIKEKWENLKGGIKDITSGVVDGFKSAFDIHSPSRVFRDQIGKMLPEGMALGIEENISAVTDAMDELQDKTTNAISGSAIGYGVIDDMTVSSSSYSVQSKVTKAEQYQSERILEILTKYLPEIANMQIVTDTGAMVGALASKMDKELGRLAVRSGRYI